MLRGHLNGTHFFFTPPILLSALQHQSSVECFPPVFLNRRPTDGHCKASILPSSRFFSFSFVYLIICSKVKFGLWAFSLQPFVKFCTEADYKPFRNHHCPQKFLPRRPKGEPKKWSCHCHFVGFRMMIFCMWLKLQNQQVLLYMMYLVSNFETYGRSLITPDIC